MGSQEPRKSMNILDKIKSARITQLTQELQKYHQLFQHKSFFTAIENSASKKRLALIAEFKRASPSAGIIAENFDLDKLAQEYLRKGALGFSVLTEESYFLGANAYLQYLAQNYAQIPILRKDFIFHPFQVFQAKLLGAAAILLIVNFIDFDKLQELHQLALDLALDVVVEVHNKAELALALKLKGLKILGINNRDLTTFSTDLNHSFEIFQQLPQERSFLTISESGFKTQTDLDKAKELGFDGVLIGEALVKGELLTREL